MSVQAKRHQKRQDPRANHATLTRNGENSNGAYVPPPGFTPVDRDVDCAEFDWDAIREDEDTELWLVKAPEEIKPKYLERLQLDHDAPRSSRNSLIGTLNRKTTVYDVWSISGSEESPVGGEEVLGLSCLLPRQKKGGRLYKTPKTISRHIVIAPPLASPDPNAEGSAQLYQNAARFSYPNELLKHQFLPIGSESPSYIIPVDRHEHVEDVDIGTGGIGKEKKSKKRKVDEKMDSPKKSRKYLA